MIKYTICRPEHFDLFKPKLIFENENYHKTLLQAFAEKNYGFSYTYFKDNEILGCVGGHELWRGVAEVWAWLSDLVRKYPVEFTKKIRNCLDFHQEKLGLHRYQMYVRASERDAIRWAKLLGFSPEGVMHKYGIDGSNYLMMGRVM